MAVAGAHPNGYTARFDRAALLEGSSASHQCRMRCRHCLYYQLVVRSTPIESLATALLDAVVGVRMGRVRSFMLFPSCQPYPHEVHTYSDVSVVAAFRQTLPFLRINWSAEVHEVRKHELRNIGRLGDFTDILHEHVGL